jgi:arylsulfatase A-like enzyme
VVRALATLWARLLCFAGLAAILFAGLHVLLGIDGWLYYETVRETASDIGARVAIGLGIAGILGTGAFLLTLPYVFWRPANFRIRAEGVARAAFAMMLVLGACGICGLLLRWVMVFGRFDVGNKTYILSWACLSLLLFVVVSVGYVLAPKLFVPSNELMLACSGQRARRLILLAGLGGLLTAFSNPMSAGMTDRQLQSARRRNLRKGKNVVLVTFDALSMEDVSLNGYRLPTTPNIDSLAHKGASFTNFYGSSTFTTPCVVSMLTGRYPSNTHVYHYGGRLRGEAASQTLPNVLRAGGYLTAASVANPGAHPACLGFGADFDLLPDPPIKDFATREAAAVFHSAALANDAGLAGRAVPYILENLSPRLFGQTHSNVPPDMSFQQAERLLHQLHDPFFLWVHVYAPHFPYLPEPPYLKQFLQSDEFRTHSDFANMFDLKGYHYSASKQQMIDKARLRYDEWVAQADGAFGQFMTTLQRTGHSMDTATIVSSDHGESFAGGYVGHGGPRQLRSILHVPLVVHLPGMTEARQISTAADQTRLAPTILEIAGIERPGWMDGQSLCGLMRGEAESEPARAFTQYFEANSAFEPIHTGTVGVIDGRHQYVFDLSAKAGSLYDLSESDVQQNELSGSEPDVAADLRNAIQRRFPDVLPG